MGQCDCKVMLISASGVAMVWHKHVNIIYYVELPSIVQCRGQIHSVSRQHYFMIDHHCLGETAK